jgi:formate dehydrogenase subunit delta
MKPEYLVKMANQIGAFYATQPNRTEAVAAVARHLTNMWEPRMRTALLAHIDRDLGAGLDEIVLEAVAKHRGVLGGAGGT